MSGSDGGQIFFWDKVTGKIVNIVKGDKVYYILFYFLHVNDRPMDIMHPLSHIDYYVLSMTQT